MRKMTKAERHIWLTTHSDYRCRVGGVPCILELDRDTGATVLVAISNCRQLRESADTGAPLVSGWSGETARRRVGGTFGS